MTRYLTLLALFVASTAAARGMPGASPFVGDAGSEGAMAGNSGQTTTEQREQFRCEQTREQIQELLGHKDLQPSDRDSLASLRSAEKVSCLPPLVSPPPSAASHPAQYPMRAMRQQHQGVVIVTADIAADGSVSHDSVYRSSGFSELDRAALDAVHGWHFDASKGTSVRVPVNFSL